MKGHSRVFQTLMFRFQRTTPLKASRAISFHLEGSRTDDAEASWWGYVRSVLARLDAERRPLSDLEALYRRGFATGTVLPAAGVGSRLSRLINKPIAVVDGVNTAVQLTLNAATVGMTGRHVVAVDQSIAARILKPGVDPGALASGDPIPRASLSDAAMRRYVGDPEAERVRWLTRARPKSARRGRSPGNRMKLSGFRSRCRIRRRWAKATASSSLRRRVLACGP